MAYAVTLCKVTVSSQNMVRSYGSLYYFIAKKWFITIVLFTVTDGLVYRGTVVL